MPSSFLARHRTICAVLAEIKERTTDPVVTKLADEAITYAQSMSAKLSQYKESRVDRDYILSRIVPNGE